MGRVVFHFIKSSLKQKNNIFVLYILIGNIRQKIIREVVIKNFSSFLGY